VGIEALAAKQHVSRVRDEDRKGGIDRTIALELKRADEALFRAARRARQCADRLARKEARMGSNHPSEDSHVS
jgi:hypothetical protein